MLLFRRQSFRMVTFDCQAGSFQNFSRSRVMVIGVYRFPTPRDPPDGGVGRPKHPQRCLQIKKIVCVSEPQEHFWKKKIVGKKNLDIFRLPPNLFIFAF